MKLALYSLLIFCGGLVSAAQPGVTVELRSCRTEYRTHARSTAPGLVCTLELIPPPGMYMCESASLTGIIRIKDSRGGVRLADRRSLDISANNRAFTTFTSPHRPTGSKIELEGELVVTVADNRIVQPSIEVNLLEAREYQLGEIKLRVNPSPANRARTNRERSKLRRAELTLTSSNGNIIRRVERIWKGENGEEFTQPVEITTVGRPSDGSVSLSLWDTDESEFLRIVTVRNPRRENVNFRLNVSLGEVTTR